jgi:hypothetical protein
VSNFSNAKRHLFLESFWRIFCGGIRIPGGGPQLRCLDIEGSPVAVSNKVMESTRMPSFSLSASFLAFFIFG